VPDGADSPDPERHAESAFLFISQSLSVCVSVGANGSGQVRANVSEIALCLEDAVPAIADTAHLFFTELSKKSTLCCLPCLRSVLSLTVCGVANNPVYNLLPSILSNLSESGDLAADAFQRIMRFLLSFVDKDRQMETLVEKLCTRFTSTKGNYFFLIFDHGCYR
jgi:condensin complex subunit 1